MEIELGPKMQACSERERKFVWEYLGLLSDGERNASEAARRAGYADLGDHSSSIRVRAHELMHRDRVRAAMREVAERHFEGMLLETVMAAQAIVRNPKHRGHGDMVKSVLGSLGLGEVSRLRVEGQITLNHTDAAVEDLARLVALGVSRDKLIETFGFSGLERYERILAEKQPKLIEGKVENG